jgi:hypothetical protein
MHPKSLMSRIFPSPRSYFPGPWGLLAAMCTYVTSGDFHDSGIFLLRILLRGGCTRCTARGARWRVRIICRRVAISRLGSRWQRHGARLRPCVRCRVV